jgi:DNA-binding transcriptional regulator YbjK
LARTQAPGKRARLIQAAAELVYRQGWVPVFYSSAAALLAHQEVELPFPVIPDPHK